MDYYFFFTVLKNVVLTIEIEVHDLNR